MTFERGRESKCTPQVSMAVGAALGFLNPHSVLGKGNIQYNINKVSCMNNTIRIQDFIATAQENGCFRFHEKSLIRLHHGVRNVES